MHTIIITPEDDRYTIREALRRVTEPHVLVVLPWDVEKGWRQVIDYEVLFRIVPSRGLQVVWVTDDPIYRPLIRQAGFPVMASPSAAEAYLAEHGELPPVKPPKMPPQPKRPWWVPEPRRPQLPLRRRQPLWLVGLELMVLLAVLVTIGVTAVLSGPSAHIALVPASITYSRVIAISVDPSAEFVDLQAGVIPAHRIGDEFEGYVDVGTTGRSFSFTGRATGRVLFTNLLGQDYQVPAGTIVRTSAGSYPVRYATTHNVTVPTFGQVEAAIEALEEGPKGNVGVYQINLIEGVVGFAVRVTNPQPISGAESKTVPAVSEADRDRAWGLAVQQVLAEAYVGLQDSSYLEPGDFLPQQALVIQAAPKTAYTHLVGEQTPKLGLALRLLVSGQAVRARDAQAIAHRQLALQLPDDYALIDASFVYGEAAEEDVGPGLFTFYVKSEAYAAANISAAQVVALVTGKSATEVGAILTEALPLARPPEVTVTPAWFPYLPFMPIRIDVSVIPDAMPQGPVAHTP